MKWPVLVLPAAGMITSLYYALPDVRRPPDLRRPGAASPRRSRTPPP
ncbi:hypothetical protein [Microbispora bryophytorum]